MARTMKILIAPDSFKESLDAPAAARAIAAGLRQGLPGAAGVCLPVADGGEGTARTLVEATGGRLVKMTVTGPLGDPVLAHYGLLGDGEVAVIEMAAASGLALVPPDRRDPAAATSFGSGELIRHALDAGVREIILGLGGSATNDAGAGMIQALGAQLLDTDGWPVGQGGGQLDRVARVDTGNLDARLKECRFRVACDVDNPLTGPRGASRVYGPQKGADAVLVERLDANLAHYGALLEQISGRDLVNRPGAGAAGGLAVSLLAFCDATLEPGIDLVLSALDFDRHLAEADLVITGEGRFDAQSAHGKAVMGVAARAARHRVPVVVLAGSLGPGYEALLGKTIRAAFACVPGICSLDEALANAATNLTALARNVAAVLALPVLQKEYEG
ncbi:MAG: glycerate kinase [Geothermobacteraceae bacterium]